MAPHQVDTYTTQSNGAINRLVQGILILLFAGAIFTPLVHYFIIYPSFTRLLLQQTEDEAIRSGSHIKRILLNDNQVDQIHLDSSTHKEMEDISRDFSLMKIKIFSPSGEVIYSTDKDEIGTVNQVNYFHEKIAKGQTVTNVVQQNSDTLEGQSITRDVVETYVPIMHQEDFVGALEIYYDISARKNDLDQLISNITYQLVSLSLLLIATIAFIYYRAVRMLREHRLMEEKLNFLANTDPLTQLCNRRRFMERLDGEISRFLRYSHPASLLIFDIDHFKKINDTYGHQTGDDVLRELAQSCKAVLRDNDLVGRYGGEEFIVFLPETDREHAMQVAEKLRTTVEEFSLPHSDTRLSVTISVGVAPFPRSATLTKDEIIRQADAALYEAKNSGRNRVASYRQAG